LLPQTAETGPQRPASASWPFIVLKIGLTALAIAAVVRTVDIVSAWQKLPEQRLGSVLLAAAVIAFQMVIAGLRWHVIIKQFTPTANLAESLRVYYIGNFFNAFLFGTMGGDVMRAWLAYRVHADMSAAAISVLLDRIASLAGLAILVLISVPLALSRIGHDAAVITLAGLAAAGLAGIAIVAQLDRLPSAWLRRRPLRLLHMLGEATRTVFLRRAVAVPALLLAVLAQVLVVISVYFLAVSLDANVSFANCLFLMQIVTLVTSLPISLGGWGVREATMIAVFGLVGVPASTMLLLSVESGLLAVAIVLPAGILWLMLDGSMRHSDKSVRDFENDRETFS
jgi:hypothetical protein